MAPMSFLILAVLARAVCGRMAPSRRAPMPVESYGGEETGVYNYMPEEKVLTCVCAKCGASSVYEFLYTVAFKQAWNYTDAPFVQNIASTRWQGKFERLDSNQVKTVIADPDVFSFALIRDPTQRLVASWKAKVACDGPEDWGTDVEDRAWMVPALAQLAGIPHADCLGFEAYLEALAKVHRMGKAPELNEYFRPQQYSCFRDHSPPEWSMVAPVKDDKVAQELAQRFAADAAAFPDHSTTYEPMKYTENELALLHEITGIEYVVLSTRFPLNVHLDQHPV